MPAASPTPPKRVLIVDRSKDSRDVMKTVLERHGLEILEATELSAAVTAIQKFHPRVVVMDTESIDEPPSRLRQTLDHELADAHAQLVVLGNVAYRNRNQSHFVRKPYHYGPLIRTIEQLADQSPLPSP